MSTKIDFTNYNELIDVSNTFKFLYKLNIKSAEPVFNELERIMGEEFCSDCLVIMNHCECDMVYSRVGGRYGAQIKS